MAGRIAAIGGVIALAAACDGEESEPPPQPRPSASAIDQAAWQPIAIADDPYAARAPAEGIVCDPLLGYTFEAFGGVPAFEIDTGACNFLTVAQPMPIDVRADEHLVISVWHFELIAEIPAEGFVGLAIDGQPRWDVRVPIPSPSGFIQEEIAVDEAIAVGTPVQFHVDNHGENTWVIVDLVREPDEPAPEP